MTVLYPADGNAYTLEPNYRKWKSSVVPVQFVPLFIITLLFLRHEQIRTGTVPVSVPLPRCLGHEMLNHETRNVFPAVTPTELCTVPVSDKCYMDRNVLHIMYRRKLLGLTNLINVMAVHLFLQNRRYRYW